MTDRAHFPPSRQRNRAAELLTRLSRATVASAVAALGVAALEAYWSLRSGSAVSWFQVARGEFGLLAPLAFSIALGAVVVSQLRHRQLSPGSPADAAPISLPERSQRVALGLVGLLVLFAATGLGFRQLASEAPAGSSGLRFGVGFGLLVLWGWLLSQGLARLTVFQRLVNRLTGPASALLVALTVVAVIALAVLTGSTAGQGSVPSMFGVLRRPELDLRAPLLGLGWLALTYGSLLYRRWSHWLGAFAVGTLAIAAPMAAVIWLEAPGVAVSVEQAPLARTLLAASRRWSDLDRDGSSRWYGGGDCDDRDPAIGPSIIDLPGNGIDEDCSGADSEPPTPPTPPAEPRAVPQPDSAPRVPDALNIVLITIDTLRFDVGYAGNPRPVSPNMDAIAARSTVYERAYSLASYTGKSIGPLLIGRYPSETHRGWRHFNKFPAQDVMIQERIKAQGMTTLSVQAHWYFDVDTGLGRGFDVLDLSAAPSERQGEGDRGVTSDLLSDAALRLLGEPQRKSERFFMWVHYLDPHAEYVRHEAHAFGNDQRALYDGEVAFTDQHIGRVLDFIAASEFAARTAIVITSDHGEAFGEHGMMRHGFQIWEALVRVPLLIFVPGAVPQRIAVRRGGIDLAPTLAELAGIDPEPGMFSGTSLLPEVLGADAPARPVVIDMPEGPFNQDRQALIAVDGHKLLMGGVRPFALFDLNADPDEQNNLLARTELVKRYLSEFKALRDQWRLVRVTPHSGPR